MPSRPKKLHGPVNPLGAGIALPKELRPAAVKNPMERLAKPFVVPIKRRETSGADGGALQRQARKRVVSYAEGEAADGTVLVEIDANLDDDRGPVKRLHALLVRHIPSQSITTLHKRFAPPLKNLPAGRAPPPPLGTRRKPVEVPRPLFDPTEEFAIVLYDPTVDVIPELVEETPEPLPEDTPTAETPPSPSKRVHKSLAEILGITPPGEDPAAKYPNVPVIVDPRLAKILRPHQVAGVKFLYRCTAGLIDARAKGCIMADEMGLGKTLQCLTLMWTLLKQGPRGRRTIDKAIIVCPLSLVRNWANEIVKWLGEGVLTPLAIDGKGKQDVSESLKAWSIAMGRNIVRPVLIISYETLRRNVDVLLGTEVGLILADEGHRLKNGDSLTFTALDLLKCERRVILLGTPIQNDLSEYFSLLSFANPGLLGLRNEFRKNFENAILKGRDADADDKMREKGDAKLAELSQLVNKFIIRRTNDILLKYLPVKYEHVVFIGLLEMQEKLYEHFLLLPEMRKLLKGVGLQPLKAIGMLKKLCTHPDLLNLQEDFPGCEDLIPDDYESTLVGGGRKDVQTWVSTKFMVLERFLAEMRRTTDDKIVLILNYTQTLDLIERMCRQRRYGCVRLDGLLGINKRQKLVDRFNDPEGKEFIFLLSSKAGGCGINLIGANRLVLLDPDWNPAADQQALARVWRDGQKKDCFIYRFISAGTIEEKIFQRQLMKLSLSSCVVDENEDVERLFSAGNLKDLFKFNKGVVCDTHDTYKCKRCKDGRQAIKAPAMLYGDATTWNHIGNPELCDNHDTLLLNEASAEDVRFVFQYISH